MRRLVTVTLVVGLVVGSVLLAGCQSDDDPDPKVSPTESSSGTPTPTPTGPVEPTLPAEAEGDDAAAAEAFVRFYWEMVNYAQATGEVERLAALGAQECSACRAGLESISRTYESGGSITGGEMTVSDAEATRITAHVGRAFSVAVSGDAASQTIREPGKEPRAYDGGPVQFKFIVQNDAEGWVVARWDLVK